MNEIYGIYVRVSTKYKWHWEKACPNYPTTDIESMVSTAPVHEKYLCAKCLKLDISLISSQQYSETNENNSSPLRMFS